MFRLECDLRSFSLGRLPKRTVRVKDRFTAAAGDDDGRSSFLNCFSSSSERYFRATLSIQVTSSKVSSTDIDTKFSRGCSGRKLVDNDL